jgi:plastocyanin
MPDPKKSIVRKAATVRKAAQAARPPATVDLSPGDTLEFSISSSVRVKGQETWIKFGITTAVQPGETAEQANDRLNDLVVSGMTERIDNYING